MNVYSQLVKAKLEQLSSDLSDKGLIWLNTASKRYKYHDGDQVREIVEKDLTQTLTSKTLTTPIIAQIKPSSGKTLTLPDVDDTLVGKTTTDTLTNKTLTTPVIASLKPDVSNTLTMPVATDTLVGKATTDTLTNKTIVAANNIITTAASGALTANELNAALAQLVSLIGSNATIPMGTITSSILSTPPAGFISAMNKSIGLSGADYNGATYQALYEELWTLSGLSTTAGDPFRISSAKGASAAADWTAGKLITLDFVTNEVFLRAKGASRNLASYQADAFQNITGSSGAAGLMSGTTSGAIVTTGTTINQYGGGGGSRTTFNFDASQSPGARTADETRPKNVAVNYFIKY